MNFISNLLKREKFKDFLIILFLFLLPIIFFWKIVFLKQVFFGGDITFQNLPQRVWVAQQFKKGIFPLWCPNIFSGFPLFAEGQTGYLYPFNLLFLILPGYIAYHYIFILHFFLAGLFMYLFMRVLKLDRISSLIVSLFFMFYLFPNFEHINVLNATIWLPLILIFIELTLRKNNFIFLLFAGITLAIIFFAGHPQTSFIILLILFFYLMSKIILPPIKNYRNYRKAILSLALFFLIPVLIGVGVSAIQLFPTYELTGFSWRVEKLPWKEFTYSSAHPFDIGSALLCFNREGKQNLEIWPNYFYLIVLFLVIIGILIKKDKRILFFIIISILGLILSFGKYTPVYKLLYYVPIFNRFRIPDFYSLIFIFFLFIVSGYSLNFILNTPKIKNLYIFIISIVSGYLSSCLIFFLIFYYQKNITSPFWPLFIKSIWIPTLILFLILGLTTLLLSNRIKILYFKILMITIVLFIIYSNYRIFWDMKIDNNPIYTELVKAHGIQEGIENRITPVSPSVYKTTPRFIEFLKRDKELFRIITDPDLPLRPNHSLYFDISVPSGYGPLGYVRAYKLFKLLTENTLDLVGIKYYLTQKKQETPAWELVFQDEGIYIYKNKKFLPRAFIVHEYMIHKPIIDEYEIIGILHDRRFEPSKTVIFEEEIDIDSDLIQAMEYARIYSTVKKEKVKIIKYTPHEVIMKGVVKVGGFLVLTDSYYPGWNVYVDGKRTKIYRANYLFRAIYLPDGEHIIRFKYEPLSFKIGMVISIFTLCLTFGITSVKSIIYKSQKR